MVIDKLKQIRLRIDAAAQRAGRDPRKVSLIAVTKYAKLESIIELLDSGLVSEIGENRVQDAQKKKEALGERAGKVAWRLIGHLQTNKAKHALKVFDAIDSIDSLKVAKAIEGQLAGGDRKLPVLVQVKLSDKETQSGTDPKNVGGLLKELETCPHLDVRGLMAIAPDTELAEAARPHFKRLRELFERHFGGREDAQLSMGMSRDFEVAVEEGATVVRVGSSIFS